MTRHRLPHEMANPLLSLHPERATTLRNIVNLTVNDRNRIDHLLDLVSAHLTLADPSDQQGASWVVAEAVRLAGQYGFDDPDLVGHFVAEAIL